MLVAEWSKGIVRVPTAEMAIEEWWNFSLRACLGNGGFKWMEED
jgi:hypothetical protein